MKEDDEGMNLHVRDVNARQEKPFKVNFPSCPFLCFVTPTMTPIAHCVY